MCARSALLLIGTQINYNKQGNLFTRESAGSKKCLIIFLNDNKFNKIDKILMQLNLQHAPNF